MADTKVVIHYFDDMGCSEATEVLADLAAKDVNVYDGLIEAKVSSENLETLFSGNLVVELPHGVEEGDANLFHDKDEAANLFLSLDRLPGVETNLIESFSNLSSLVDFAPGKAGLTVLEKIRAQGEPLLDGLEMDKTEAPSAGLLSVDAYLLLFSDFLRPQWQETLKELGVTLEPFQPPYAYRAILTVEQLDSVKQLPYVKVKRYGLRETVTASLLKKTQPSEPETEATREQPAAPVESASFDLIVHRASDMESVLRILEGTTGVTIVSRSEMAVRFEADPRSPVLSALANLPAVRILTPYEAPKVYMDHAREILGISAVRSCQGLDLTGEGETLAMFDSGIDIGHPDFLQDRVVMHQYGRGSATDTHGHGTHVAGIMVGSGSLGPVPGPGVAPQARLISVGIEDPSGKLDVPPDLGQLLNIAVANGARIINLSWGFTFGGDYEVYGESMDRFVYEHPDVLVVVAAGNQGKAPKGKHQPQTIGQPAGAKNVLTVGASASDRPGTRTWGQIKADCFPMAPAKDEQVTGNFNLPAAISGRGPTDYETVKPDVLAPGTMIMSARAKGATIGYFGTSDSPHYGYLNGTSMACPLVAGSAALLRQFLRVKAQKPQPSAALLKALLILSSTRMPMASANSVAVDIGYPDFDQGFGRIDLRSILPHPASPGQRRLTFDDVGNDDSRALASRQRPGGPRKSSRSYRLELDADSNLPLRLVLVWTDVPGRSLQNVLEMMVRCPDGRTFMGNHELLAFRPLWAKDLTAPVPHRSGNVLFIGVPNPVKGKYRVTIMASDTPFPTQGYALAACGEFSGDLTEC